MRIKGLTRAWKAAEAKLMADDKARQSCFSLDLWDPQNWHTRAIRISINTAPGESSGDDRDDFTDFWRLYDSTRFRHSCEASLDGEKSSTAGLTDMAGDQYCSADKLGLQDADLAARQR